MPDILLHCILEIFILGPTEISKRRIITWRKICDELGEVENTIHEHLPDHLKKLSEGKRFAVLEKMAQEINWPDTQLRREIVQGFKLIGRGTATGVFEESIKHATLTEDELMDQCKSLKPMIIGKMLNSPKPEYCDELNQITADETADRAWLEGPYSYADLGGRFGDRWIPAQ